MSEIKWFLLLLAAGFLILLFRHIQLKKQIRNLSGQVKEWNRGNSGQMIDIYLLDKDFERHPKARSPWGATFSPLR